MLQQHAGVVKRAIHIQGPSWQPECQAVTVQEPPRRLALPRPGGAVAEELPMSKSECNAGTEGPRGALFHVQGWQGGGEIIPHQGKENTAAGAA